MVCQGIVRVPYPCPSDLLNLRSHARTTDPEATRAAVSVLLVLRYGRGFERDLSQILRGDRESSAGLGFRQPGRRIVRLVWGPVPSSLPPVVLSSACA